MNNIKSTIGFESFITMWRMRWKMYRTIASIYLVMSLLATFLLTWYCNGSEWKMIMQYIWNSTTLFSWPSFAPIKEPIHYLIWWSVYCIIFVFFGVVVLSFFFKKKLAKDQMADRYLSGARMISTNELVSEMKRNREDTDIPLSRDIQMPKTAEVKHVFIIGRPGTGKTVFLSQVLHHLIKREEKAVIHDFKGDYISRFYNPDKDLIFNPLDMRGVNWNIFNEIKTVMDIEAIAASLIPESYGPDNFFNKAARDVLVGILHYLWQNNLRTNDALYSSVTATGEEIAAWLKNTPSGEAGYVYIQDPNSKQALSVLATLMTFTSCFKYMPSGNDCDFSITQWVESGKGMIFVSNYADIKDTLKPILSLFIDVAGRGILSLPDNLSRRVFFFLDEFGTLQKLTTIQNLLTASRSKGGSVWLGIQDIGQLDKIYTPAGRQTIVNAAGNSMVFSVSDPDSAEFLSKKIGDIEFSRTQESYVTSPNDYRDSINLTRLEKVKRLVLGSDITNLKDLECYLKIANYDITKTKLDLKQYKERDPGFKLRQELSI
ncbi:MAG: type IV secretion system DNA-binding domain-containing protein [Deltaproteobacteria bacterium]|nr:type IV secretion system DNA-binding domain-containing protein [Deltaproteobacteria bacterium]